MDLEAFDKARAVALKSLAASARSQSEIERRLRRAEADEEMIAKIIEEFTGAGLVGRSGVRAGLGGGSGGSQAVRENAAGSGVARARHRQGDDSVHVG